MYKYIQYFESEYDVDEKYFFTPYQSIAYESYTCIYFVEFC